MCGSVGLIEHDRSVEKEKWHAEWEAWSSRRPDELEVVHVWVDALYVKAGSAKEKVPVLMVLATLSDGSKVIVAVRAGYRESKEAWGEILRDLKARG